MRKTPTRKPRRAPELCSSCESRGNKPVAKASPGHTCPYASEINGSETECDCCDDCTRECAMDI